MVVAEGGLLSEVCSLSQVRDSDQGKQKLGKSISLSDLSFLFCKVGGTPTFSINTCCKGAQWVPGEQVLKRGRS